MKVECKRQVEASEPDEDGQNQYRYEYDAYEFTDGSMKLIAVSLIDTPAEASFLRIEENGEPQWLSPAHFETPLVQQAISHLKDQGKSEIKWLDRARGGYAPLPGD